MTKRILETAERVEIDSADALHAWLDRHGGQQEGVWVVTWKKGADPEAHVSAAEVGATALAHGWIDSLPRKLDETRSMLYIAPRKPGSNWSRVNKERIARLRAEGRMRPEGEAAVARAEADGSWTALDEVEDLVVPDDLARALDTEARKTWDAYPRSVRRGALEQLVTAKTDATRAKRIAIIVEATAAGERPFQWRGPKTGG